MKSSCPSTLTRLVILSKKESLLTIKKNKDMCIKSTHFNRFLIGFMAVLAATVSGCGKTESPEENGIEVSEAPTGSGEVFLTEEQFKTMEMQWGNPQQGEFSGEVNVQGMVQIPVEGMQEISAYFGGYVSDLSLIEGQAVRKGQTLFFLENPDFIRLQQDYLETKWAASAMVKGLKDPKKVLAEFRAEIKNVK